MKQPILFQNRAIDLERIAEYMYNDLREELNNTSFSSDAEYLHAYLTSTSFQDTMLLAIVQHEFNIDISSMNYSKVERPYAVDCRTGECYPISALEFTPCGKLDGAIVHGSEGLIFWSDSASPLRHLKSDRRIEADIKILYDGWFYHE